MKANRRKHRPLRKAANLAELQKYFKAASEAALEVCAEQGDEALGEQIRSSILYL